LLNGRLLVAAGRPLYKRESDGKKNCEGGIEIKWISDEVDEAHKRIFIPIGKATEKGGKRIK
jgi:hypothetical protein